MAFIYLNSNLFFPKETRPNREFWWLSSKGSSATHSCFMENRLQVQKISFRWKKNLLPNIISMSEHKRLKIDILPWVFSLIYDSAMNHYESDHFSRFFFHVGLLHKHMCTLTHKHSHTNQPCNTEKASPGTIMWSHCWHVEGTVAYSVRLGESLACLCCLMACLSPWKDTNSHNYILIKKNNLINLGNVFHNSVIFTRSSLCL